MKKLYELSAGDVFWYGKVLWRVCEFTGNHRICRPTSCPETGSSVRFDMDEEVQVYDF